MTTDHIEQLERLVRLKESGALNEAEFEREKAHLLADNAAEVRSPPGGLSTSRLRHLLWGGVVAVALAGGLGAAVVIRANAELANSEQPPVPGQTSEHATKVVERHDSAPGSLRALPSERQYALAFQAVFGGREPISQTADGTLHRYGPGRLVWTPIGAVLVLPGTNEQAYPVTTGALGLFYLKERDGDFIVDRRWPNAVEGSTMGNPPEWDVSGAFGDMPVIVSTAGGVWQGIRCATTTLIELAPTGPVDLVSFRAEYDNSAAARNGAGVESIKGSITNIVSGKSFDVGFTGSRNFTHKYGRLGHSYGRTDSGETQELPEC